MPARRPHTLEAAARHDLDTLPPMYRYSALAGIYLVLARRIDAGVPTRDMGPLMREMRQCWLALLQLAPAKAKADPGDEVGRKRQERLEAAQARREAD